MFSIFKVKIDLNLGPSITGIGNIGPTSGSISPASVSDLTIPWRQLQEHHSDFSLLSWHTRVSDFAGRDKETQTLLGWAGSEPAISMKFITGEGEVGLI